MKYSILTSQDKQKETKMLRKQCNINLDLTRDEYSDLIYALLEAKIHNIGAKNNKMAETLGNISDKIKNNVTFI